MSELKNLIIEDAELIFRNFSGREGRYNRAGDRNFSVIIPDSALAEQLKCDGWNVKAETQGPEREETGRYYISGVSINFAYFIPPVIMYENNGNMIQLSEETLDGPIAAQLDGRGAERFDVSIRPRTWDRNDGTIGVKGYVEEMRIVAKKSLFGGGFSYGDEE